MKRIFLMLLALSAILSVKIHAHTTSKNDFIDHPHSNIVENKIYLFPEQISFSDQGIVIHMEDIDFSVFSIHTDHHGIFITEQDFQMWRENFCSCTARLCPSCGRCTDRGNSRCSARKCNGCRR